MLGIGEKSAARAPPLLRPTGKAQRDAQWRRESVYVEIIQIERTGKPETKWPYSQDRLPWGGRTKEAVSNGTNAVLVPPPFAPVPTIRRRTRNAEPPIVRVFKPPFWFGANFEAKLPSTDRR